MTFFHADWMISSGLRFGLNLGPTPLEISLIYYSDGPFYQKSEAHDRQRNGPENSGG
jgi:hypothetical protein